MEQAMFAVIFIVQPKAGRENDYLDLAKSLKPKIEAIDGFIDNDRGASTRGERRILSLSTWRDEKALVRWRTQPDHHRVQEKARFEVFENYLLWIGEFTHDSDAPNGGLLQQQRFDATETSPAKAVTVAEIAPQDGNKLGTPTADVPKHLGLGQPVDGLVDVEAFDSIYHPGKVIVMAFWRDAAAAEAWTPRRPDAAASTRHRRVRIIRAYGMSDRREAAQCYPEVKEDGVSRARPTCRGT
jgi:heme-degrading monooxygenase HmoA